MKETEINLGAVHLAENNEPESFKKKFRGRPKKNIIGRKLLHKSLKTTKLKKVFTEVSSKRAENCRFHKKKPKIVKPEDWVPRARRKYPGQKFHCTNAGCDRIYTNKKSLIRHLKYECGILPSYKCAYCDYFAQYENLVVLHQKRYHPNEKFRVFQKKDGKLLECILK